MSTKTKVYWGLLVLVEAPVLVVLVFVGAAEAAMTQLVMAPLVALIAGTAWIERSNNG
jgi:hypothetical protein